jgi:hypothetical protein
MPADNVAPGIQTTQQMMQSFISGRRTPSGISIPKSAVPVFSLGFQVAPAYGGGNQVVLTTYQVKANWYAIICGVVLQFAGTTPPNPGDVSFSVDIDRPLGNFTAGYVEKDYGDIEMLLGSFIQDGPWPTEFRHEDGEVIRIKAVTIANMSTGAGNFLIGALWGYEWPREGWEG